MKILVINGPNLNMLKDRDSNHYGNDGLQDIENELKKNFKEIEFNFFQSNIEGEIVNAIQDSATKYDALIINPAAYSHTSVAIHDALELTKIIKVEVHLSNISGREDFRKNMITAPACDGYIAGFKSGSYLAAAYLIKSLIKN